jgi:hypothetical protein
MIRRKRLLPNLKCVFEEWQCVWIITHRKMQHTDAVADLAFFKNGISQVQSMGPIWNLWRMILDPNGRFLRKKFFDRSLRKKFRFWKRRPLNFFLFLAIIYFLEFHRDLHRISSTDFKFHLKICIRSGVMTFWIFVPFFGTYFKNWKRYHSWTDPYI